MIVLVDTTIWSLALRRRSEALNPEEVGYVEEWKRLVETGEAVLIRPIRQEILSGIRGEKTFATLRRQLDSFQYPDLLPADYDRAAQLFNLCRSRGVTGTPVDLLICAVARRLGASVFTTDRDFEHYAPIVNIQLHQ